MLASQLLRLPHTWLIRQAMSSEPELKLISAATAIAIIACPKYHLEINKLRSIHDKAYRKWQPHINIIYPFVQASQLNDALVVLKSAFQKTPMESITIKIDQVGVFRHRKNATVFLQPDEGSSERIRVLRKALVEALGRDEGEGTHDGVFRPHLTVGQAGLQGDLIEKLWTKVEKLRGMEWECLSLAVLKRLPTGEMEVVDTLNLKHRDVEQ